MNWALRAAPTSVGSVGVIRCLPAGMRVAIAVDVPYVCSFMFECLSIQFQDAIMSFDKLIGDVVDFPKGRYIGGGHDKSAPTVEFCLDSGTAEGRYIGGGHDKSAPTDVRVIVLKCIINTGNGLIILLSVIIGSPDLSHC